MNRTARSVGLAAALLMLTALWLRFGPGWAAALLASATGAWGELAFTGLVYAPLAVIAFGGGALAEIGPAQVRTGWWPAAVRGALLGLVGILVALGLVAISGTLMSGMHNAVGWALGLGAATVLFQVVAEELLFRGLLQPLAVRVVGPVGGVLIAAAAFAGMHAVAGGAGALPLLNLFGGGLLFGLIALRDGGVIGAVAAHWAWNATEQLVVGLDPNPGIGGFGSMLDLDLAGAARWGGSAEGLNASWAMTVALAALVVPLAMTARRAR